MHNFTGLLYVLHAVVEPCWVTGFFTVKFNYQVLESFDYQLNYVAVEEVCYFKTKDVFLCFIKSRG